MDVEPPERSGSDLVLRGVIAGAAVAGWSWFLWSISTSAAGLVVGALLSLAYLVLAYWLRPAPEMSNLGLWGTIIDHPFRFSDGVNRFLLFLYVVFWPGRFISATFVDVLEVAASQ